MKFWSAAVAAALVVAPISSAFQGTATTTSRTTIHTQGRQASQLFADPKELTDYMVKAHEEKLKAVQAAEAKKNAEIQTLKQELKALQSAPGALATTTAAPSGMDVSSMTKEQLAQKLLSYQQFMAKYIVDAQQQKANAIAAAENSVRQKYEEKLKLLSGSSSVAATPAAGAAAIPAFEQRSAKVSAAAAAGKSRWGAMENEKASMAVGAVNGAVKVTGSVAPPALASPSSTTSLPAFDKRNAMVAAAGKADKSRWGQMEVQRATQASAGSLPASSGPAPATPAAAASFTVPPEVEAADHGLRADGGVGGPSLAERINLGSQLVDGPGASVPDGGVGGPRLAERINLGSQLVDGPGASVPAPLGNTPSPSSHYAKRSAMIAAAGLAGKSRWGDMEVQKAQSLVASLPSSSSAGPVTVTPEIEAADHGLRADGGVDGPTLAQRVNFGAALLGQ